MKKIFILSLFAFSGAMLNGQATQIANDLTVFSENGEKFIVTMNGQPLTDSAVASVTVKDIQFEYVNVRINFEDGNIPVLEKKYLPLTYHNSQDPITVKYPGVSVYQIKINNKGEHVLRCHSRSQKLIQTSTTVIIPGQIFVPQHSTPSYKVYIPR